jgi:hypothetical protein
LFFFFKGSYELSITYNKYHIIGSPFRVFFSEEEDFNHLENITGPAKGLNPIEERLNKALEQITRNPLSKKEGFCKKYPNETDQLDNNDNINSCSSSSSSDNELENFSYDISQEPNKFNHIMDPGNSKSRKILTPIIDTSEEDSGEEVEPTTKIFKGETYIENVELLPDGSSQLLLRIEDNEKNKLVDVSDPQSTKGKYKYRFKKVNNSLENNNENTKTNITVSDYNDDSNEPEQNIVDDSVKVASEEERPKDDLQNTDQSQQPENSKVSDKRKYFENKIPQSALSSVDTKEKEEENTKGSPKSNKVLDYVKQFNEQSNDSKVAKESKRQNEQETLPNNDNDEDDEIYVVNENYVTKLTKENEKKINQEKTVIIDKKFVITSKDANKKENPDAKATSESEKAKNPAVSVLDEPSEDDLVEKTENTKTSLESSTKILTEKQDSKDGKKQVENIAQYTRIDPEKLVKSDESNYDDLHDDEKLTEKLKPEETIHYEYEQVIEQPDTSVNGNQEELPSKKMNQTKDKMKVENTAKKTTKQETNEKYETITNPTDDQIRTETTDITTIITQDEEDKTTEIIEKSKDIQEFNYQLSKDKNKPDYASEIDGSQLDLLAQELKHDIEQSNQENDGFTSFKRVNNTAEIIFSHEPAEINTNTSNNHQVDVPQKSANKSSSSENIFDYYKLQPVQIPSIDNPNETKSNSHQEDLQKELSNESKSSKQEDPSESNLKSIDSLKAKFEPKAQNIREKSKTGENPENSNTNIGKLPKSKVNIYEKPNEDAPAISTNTTNSDNQGDKKKNGLNSANSRNLTEKAVDDSNSKADSSAPSPLSDTATKSSEEQNKEIAGSSQNNKSAEIPLESKKSTVKKLPDSVLKMFDAPKADQQQQTTNEQSNKSETAKNVSPSSNETSPKLALHGFKDTRAHATPESERKEEKVKRLSDSLLNKYSNNKDESLVPSNGSKNDNESVKRNEKPDENQKINHSAESFASAPGENEQNEPQQNQQDLNIAQHKENGQDAEKSNDGIKKLLQIYEKKNESTSYPIANDNQTNNGLTSETNGPSNETIKSQLASQSSYNPNFSQDRDNSTGPKEDSSDSSKCQKQNDQPEKNQNTIKKLINMYEKSSFESENKEKSDSESQNQPRDNQKTELKVDNNDQDDDENYSEHEETFVQSQYTPEEVLNDNSKNSLKQFELPSNNDLVMHKTQLTDPSKSSSNENKTENCSKELLRTASDRGINQQQGNSNSNNDEKKTKDKFETYVYRNNDSKLRADMLISPLTKSKSNLSNDRKPLKGIKKMQITFIGT